MGKTCILIVMLLFVNGCAIWTTTIDDGVHEPIKITAGYRSCISYEDPRTGVKIVDDRRGRPSTLEQILGTVTLGATSFQASAVKE